MPPDSFPRSSHSSGKPLHVLLAGNDIPSEEDLINLLKQKGLEPVPSSSLKEAQFLLSRRDTVLAICHASSSDGTFRDLLGAAGKGSRVPVIVCGDFYDPHLYLEAMELGAFDYFTYPYHSEGVEWIVGNALQAASHKTPTSSGPVTTMNEGVPC
jgi:DNA-binding NtrC family response regulator